LEVANVHVTTSLVLRDTLAHLENDLVLGNLVNTDYSKDFAKVGDTVNVRKPVRFQGQSDNLDVSAYNEDIIEGKTAITLKKTETIKFSIDPKDRVLSVEKMRERYVEPAVIKLKDRIESELAALYKDVYWFSGTPGTLPATFKALGEPGSVMTYAAVPLSGRKAVHNPDASLELADGLKGVYVQSKAKTAFEEATIGRYAGFDNFTSVHVPRHTVGAHGGTPLIAGAGQNVTYAASKDTWTQSLATDGWTVSITGLLKQGDVITIAGVNAVNPISKEDTGKLQTFVVKADVNTDATVGGPATLTISPPIITSGAYQTVSAAPADNAAITVKTGTASTAYAQSLLFHRNAFTLVTRPLEIPQGEGLATETMNGNKVSLSISKWVDGNTLAENCRLDMLFDCVAVYPQLAARLTS
jgi:hypothetical protein